jgi:DnaD/phage-associated family protein
MQLQSDLPDSDPAFRTAPVAYTRIPDSVLLDPRLTAGQLRIYAVIARRADRDKATAFPSYKTIARDAHVSRTSAINGVKALVRLGYLSKQAQESGQGDPTSNLYTISGEGSQVFVLPRPNTAANAPEAAQKLDHRSANFVPQVVQSLEHGGANSGPESYSMNKKQGNKIQENGRTRAQAREIASPPAAATDPEMQKLLNDFQENIGTLTGMAQKVLCQLAEQHGTDRVRDAIQEAVIYEKRSLAYIRRVLDAWRRNGRSTEKGICNSLTSDVSLSDFPASEETPAGEFVWPPPDLISDLPPEPDMSDPKVAAWEAICECLPQLGRMTKRSIIPRSLIGNVLTVAVSGARLYSILTHGQSISVNVATRMVLGDGATIQVELVSEDAQIHIGKSV